MREWRRTIRLVSIVTIIVSAVWVYQQWQYDRMGDIIVDEKVG